MAFLLPDFFQKNSRQTAVWFAWTFIHSQKLKLVAASSVLLLLSACGGSGTNGGITTVTGSVSDGPIIGGVVIVTDANGATVTTTPTSPVTDSTAHYRFTILSSTPLPLTVTVKNGTDSITSSVQDFDLTAVAAGALPVGGTVVLNINPVTTLVVASALSSGPLNAGNLALATTNVLNTVGFGLPVTGFDPASTKVDATNVASVIKANEAVAELIRRVGVSTGKSMLNTIKAIAEDVTDGVLDGKTAAGITATQTDAKTAGVIFTKQAEITAELLSRQLKITDKTGAIKVTATQSEAELNTAILLTQPTATGDAADVAKVPVTETFLDQTKNAISLTNILVGGGDPALNDLLTAVNALTTNAVPSVTQSTNIFTVLNNANTALVTANDNANAGTNTAAASDAATSAAGTGSNTAPTNQDTVLAAPVTVAGGGSVTIVSSGSASNTVWLAPAGTTTFTAGNTMTSASGTATSITAPAAGGTYKLFVVDVAGSVSTASTATVTVDSSNPIITANHPSTSAVNVAINAAIDIIFSEPVINVTTSTFTVTTGGTPIGGTINHNSGNNESFSPSSPLAYGTQYTVTATNSITDLAGNVLTATGMQPLTWNFITVAAPLTVGGTVSGLATGESVVLQNNGADNLTVNANGSFTFATGLANGNTYAVTILTQPTGKTCTVSNGSGTITANVSNVSVVCPASPSLNDTGITTWDNASVNNLTSTQSAFPGQDADHGRDALATGVVAGGLTKTGGSTNTNGFDFTKLAADGTTVVGGSVAYTTTPWDCVQDNNTGLMWEVKTTAGVGGLRDANHTYSWYTAGVNNGGNAGTANNGSCVDTTNCDTEKYVAAVNAVSICGFNDWRLPTREELRSIVDYSFLAFGKTIDTGYFPNTLANRYWSASPAAGFTGFAWDILFYDGGDLITGKNNALAVRLVRGGQ